MFAYLKGKIIEKNSDYMLLEAQGIGYQIGYDEKMVGRFPKQGEDDALVWVYLHVHDDVYSLYGFPTREEKNLFEMLRTVNGIGPKSAGQIVASLSPETFAMAVITDNVKALTTIKGIGKKTAQRLILELKDKIKTQIEIPAEDDIEMPDLETEETGNRILDEAIDALIVLGYSPQIAKKAVSDAVKQLQKDDTAIDLETVIRQALKNQSKV